MCLNKLIRFLITYSRVYANRNCEESDLMHLYQHTEGTVYNSLVAGEVFKAPESVSIEMIQRDVRNVEWWVIKIQCFVKWNINNYVSWCFVKWNINSYVSWWSIQQYLEWLCSCCSHDIFIKNSSLDKMAAILQAPFSYVFYWMKHVLFWFHM